MPHSFDSYIRCFRCGTSRPKAKLLAGICRDNFCSRVLEASVAVARRHTAWWMRRYPAMSGHREDIFQEAVTAAWLAWAEFREGQATFHTYAFPKMRTAVRTYLGLKRRVVVPDETVAAVSPLETDVPCLVAEATRELLTSLSWLDRSGRDRELLSRLELGQTLQEAGEAVGISRQRAHQIARAATRARD